MSEKLYGIYAMHPMSSMVPGVEDTMPHNTYRNILFFESKELAAAAAEAAAREFRIKATNVPFGRSLSDHATMHGVGVVYQVSCPQEVYDQLKKEEVNGTAVYQGSLAGMHLENIEVRIMNDPLHSPPDPTQFSSLPYHISEMASEIAARWSDYQQFNRALQASRPEMLVALDFNNPTVHQSLCTMYGSNGLINTNFFGARDEELQLRSIERCMHLEGVGLGYILNIAELEHQYNETFNRCVVSGMSRGDAIYNAALEMMHVLENLADFYGDTKAQAYFSQLAEDIAEEGPAQDDFVIPDEYEEEIFE